MADRVGSFIEYWGFKKVHGKIWTLTFLSPEPVDANYLKDTLKISKALTSMSLKDLIHYRVLLEVEKERPGTQKYRANPNITEVILDVVKNRELIMLEQTNRQFQVFEEFESTRRHGYIDPERLGQLGEMIKMAQFLLSGMVSGGIVDFDAFGASTKLDA